MGLDKSHNRISQPTPLDSLSVLLWLLALISHCRSFLGGGVGWGGVGWNCG